MFVYSFYSPSLSRYNYSISLFDVIYNELSELLIKVVALDNGVDPVRGAIATINITLSNTCLMDVLFDEIENEVLVNQTNGGVFFRIPRYYVREFGSFLFLNGDAFHATKMLFIIIHF